MPLLLTSLALLAVHDILLTDFKGTDPSVTHTWRANNDPVMGGQSYSTVKVENEVLNFTGACKIVPFLKAPGFITAMNTDYHPWQDISSCKGAKAKAKAKAKRANHMTEARRRRCI